MADKNQYGFFDTRDVLGTITELGYVEYDASSNRVFILGQTNTHIPRMGVLVPENIFDYGGDGAFLPVMTMGGIPGYIKALELDADISGGGSGNTPGGSTPGGGTPSTNYTISARANDSSGGTVTGGGSYASGTQITVTATANGGYSFSGWRESGAIVSTQSRYTFTVTGNRALVAVFEETTPRYNISVSIDPAGGGVVTGSGRYQQGQAVTLTAIPNSGYEFSGWKEGGSTVGTDTNLIVTVTGNRSFTAVFTGGAQGYNISVSADPAVGGTVTGGGDYQEGDSVTVTAAPNSGYDFVGWRDGGEIVSTDKRYTFSAYGNRSLAAVFAALYTISASVDPSGSGTIAGAGTYRSGSSVTVTASAGSGYEFSEWTENGITVSSDASYTFTVSANRTLKAVFVKTLVLQWGVASLPALSGGSWNSMAYGNGKFVSVAYNTNQAAYSADGIGWTQVTLPVSAAWKSVAYGSGKFVAVAESGSQAVYSSDGINWTAVTLPSVGNYSLTFGGGKFVAVAYNKNTVVYSADGANWSTAAMPRSAAWSAVAYGNGKFVAVPSTGSYAAYSTDGVNWTETSFIYMSAASVVYGGGKFVAVGSGGQAAVSADGAAWSSVSLPESSNWPGIAYGNDRFVTMVGSGYVSNKVAYSEYGTSWESSTLPTSANWSGCAFGDGKFIIFAADGTVAVSV